MHVFVILCTFIHESTMFFMYFLHLVPTFPTIVEKSLLHVCFLHVCYSKSPHAETDTLGLDQVSYVMGTVLSLEVDWTLHQGGVGAGGAIKD